MKKVKIYVKDNFDDPTHIHEYDLFESTMINELIQIIKIERRIDEEFQICSKGDEIDGEEQIEAVLEHYGKIVSIQRLISKEVVDDSDEEQFHVGMNQSSRHRIYFILFSVFQKGDGRTDWVKVICSPSQPIGDVFQLTTWPSAKLRYDGDEVPLTSTLQELDIDTGCRIEVIY